MGDDEQTKLCTNCQRDIPSANYTIHSVHCTRNIAVCPKCKDPVPVNDMKKHTARVICKQCGEAMQACDMPSHISDACPETAVKCLYCELLLARALMPDHEAYCGARTERCDECTELVMIKYRKLHEESNHGFLKLDDEPGPPPSWNMPSPKSPSSKSNVASRIRASGNQIAENWRGAVGKPPSPRSPNSNNRVMFAPDPPGNSPRNNDDHRVLFGPDQFGNGPNAKGNDGFGREEAKHGLTAKRNNDMPQLNSAFGNLNSMNEKESPNKQPLARQLSASKGAIKKYQAPTPPTHSKKHKDSEEPDAYSDANAPKYPPFSHSRDVPMYSAMLRDQNQQRQREEQNAYNLEHGLPPVLNAAQKLEKLRKMSELHNAEFNDDDYKKSKYLKPKKANNLVENDRGGNVVGQVNRSYTPMSQEELAKRLERGNKVENGAQHRNDMRHFNPEDNFRHDAGRPADPYSSHQYESVEYAPYTVADTPKGRREQVNAQVNAQLSAMPTRAPQIDRFMEIKNHLKDLRKELKECSTPLEAKQSPPVRNHDRNQRGNNRGHEAQGGPPQFDHRPKVWPANGAGGNGLHLNIKNPNSAKLHGSDNRRKNEHSKVNWNLSNAPQSPDGNAYNDQSVKLPCEFCHRMVPAGGLVAHEEMCNPGLERNNASAAVDLPPLLPANENAGVPHVPHRKHRKDKHLKKMNAAANQAPKPTEELPSDSPLSNVMLPCEFCESMIPASFLVTHETGCNPQVTSINPPKSHGSAANVANAAPPNTPDAQPHPLKSTNIPKNKNLINEARNHKHKNRTASNETVTLDQLRNFDHSDDENEAIGPAVPEEFKIPCEFCMRPMPASELMHHQEACYETGDYSL